jgi:hypothetical protein
MVDTDDFEALSRPDCARGANPKDVCLDVPIALFAGQVTFQILCVWVLFLLISGTTVFQVGLIGVLLEEFQALCWIILTYFLLTLALTLYRVVKVYF